MKYRLYQGPGYEPKKLAEFVCETLDDFHGLKIVADRLSEQSNVDFFSLKGAEQFSILKVWYLPSDSSEPH